MRRTTPPRTMPTIAPMGREEEVEMFREDGEVVDGSVVGEVVEVERVLEMLESVGVLDALEMVAVEICVLLVCCSVWL